MPDNDQQQDLQPGQYALHPPEYFLHHIDILRPYIETPTDPDPVTKEPRTNINIGVLGMVMQLELLNDIRMFLMQLAAKEGAITPGGNALLLARDLHGVDAAAKKMGIDFVSR